MTSKFNVTEKVIDLNLNEKELGETLENIIKETPTEENLFNLGTLIQYGYDKRFYALPNGKTLFDYQFEASKRYGELNKKKVNEELKVA